MLNMWKLDSTRPKHVIKTNQNKQNSKNPKSMLLGMSMSVHEWSMCMHAYACLKYAYACINHAHAYTPRNTVLKHNQKTQSNKTKHASTILIQLFIQNMARHN